MNCIHCDRPAHGTCKFCGRAICKEHFEQDNFILEIYPKTEDKKDQVLYVKNVIWCGICNPIRNLIEIDLQN